MTAGCLRVATIVPHRTRKLNRRPVQNYHWSTAPTAFHLPDKGTDVNGSCPYAAGNELRSQFLSLRVSPVRRTQTPQSAETLEGTIVATRHSAISSVKFPSSRSRRNLAADDVLNCGFDFSLARYGSRQRLFQIIEKFSSHLRCSRTVSQKTLGVRLNKPRLFPDGRPRRGSD